MLGPLFLLLGTASCLASHRFTPQGRAWLLVGVIFCAVALWLHR